MTGPLRVDGLSDDNDLPIVHPDRTIGDTVELVPGNFVGQRGPLKEILRTRGRDERAQLLTVTIVGAGVYESSLLSASSAPRGPLVAVVEWGVRGAKSKVELDIPQGGVVFSLVASYVQVGARYDGLLAVNGLPLDPAATGFPGPPGPRQRVGAMVGYGSYGAAMRLTRTIRISDVQIPGFEGGNVSPRVPVPSFAKGVFLVGLGLEAISYRVQLGTTAATATSGVLVPVASRPVKLELPGDAVFVEIENLGPTPLRNPALVFELAL